MTHVILPVFFLSVADQTTLCPRVSTEHQPLHRHVDQRDTQRTHIHYYRMHMSHNDTCHTCHMSYFLCVLSPSVADQTTPCPRVSMEHPPRCRYVEQHDTWRDHLHCYQQLHCCHPKNLCHFCCHRGYYSFGLPREYWSIAGSGPLRVVAVLLMYFLCWPCCLVLLCKAILTDEGD